jgi:poly(A) polymerase
MAPSLPDRSWLDAPPTRRLISALDAAGIDFRFVGGVVRDSLLGRAVADIDIATPAAPDAVIRAVADAGLKAIPTGIAHGTVTALVDGKPFEITTLRRDVETDGRHAIVAFTEDWRADAARRDFTMNALYADRDGAVTDYFGGTADALAGRVRFIGDPGQRIREDALRILRFFRFHAWHGRGGLDPEGLAACAELARLIGRLSAERVRDETFKLLQAPDPAPIWAEMARTGIAAQIFPFETQGGDLARVVAVEAALGLPGDPLRRLAALTGPLAPDHLERLKARLKLSNHESGRLAAIIAANAEIEALTEADFGRALYRADPQSLRDAALVAHARSGLPDLTTIANLLRFSAGWTAPRFPVTGADVVARGIPPGPAVGAILAELEAWWIAADFRPGRTDVLAELESRPSG